MIEAEEAFKDVKDPEVKKLLIGIYEKPISLDIADLVEEAKNLLSEEADFATAKEITDRIQFEVPTAWYEDCLKKSIATGRYFDVSATLDILDRPLSQEEISKLIEQLILTGSMRALHEVEEVSSESFDLSVWQNAMIHRTVRLLWEKRNDYKLSPLSNILTFHLDYKDILSDFKIKVVGTYRLDIVGKTFQYFDQHTMSTFLHHLLKLDSDPLVKKIARQIKSVSVVS
jgi:hypothetical protein